MSKRDAIETLRERIEAGGGEYHYDSSRFDGATLTDDDGEALLEFSKQMDLLQSEYSDSRHEKLLRHCVRMAEQVGGVARAREDRDAAEELVAWIHASYDNEETNSDYRVALRVFGKRSLRESEVPDALDWIPAGTSRSYDPTPNIEEMLWWEDEVHAMIEAAANDRDEALFALALEAGVRPYSELYQMQVGHLVDTTIGKQLTLDGKTGERHITLIYSVPYLRKWLADHPDRGDPEAPLWSKLDKPELASHPTFLEYFQNAADRAGVEKDVTPTNFRKSNTLFLRKLGADQSFIEDRQGRKRGSKHIARYIAAFDEENERTEYAKMLGIEVDEDSFGPEDIRPIECPQCDRETPVEKRFCMWCDQALDPLAAKDFEETQSTVKRLTLRAVREDPSILDEVDRRNVAIDAVVEDDELYERALEIAGDEGERGAL